MKTTILYAAILLVAFGLGSWQKEALEPENVLAGNANTVISKDLPQVWKMIVRHQVNVVFSQETTICGNYIVEITNSEGNVVAPVQRYNPNVSVYVFIEHTNIPKGAVRIARLILAPASGQTVACQNILYTPPHIQNLYLQDAKTFYYTLKPRINASGIPN